MSEKMLSEADNVDAKWKSISIGNAEYCICAVERNCIWTVSMTNLIEIWSEELDRAKILQKCETLNPSLSIDDIDVHEFVRKLFQDIPKHTTDISIERIKLSCQLEGGLFQFAIDFTRGAALQLWEQVTMPLCLVADELKRQRTILLDLIKKKDAEISEYRLNGAELIRKHIKTEPFHLDVFKRNAPARNAQNCHDAFQRIMELRKDVKIEKCCSMKTEREKTSCPANLVQSAISTATNEETKSKSGKRLFHTLLSVEGPARKKRRRCVECYRKRRQSGLSATDAASLTKQVKTYCNNCPEKPHLCLTCFNSVHENIPTEIPNVEETLVKIKVERCPDEIDLVVDFEASEKKSPPETSELPKTSESESKIKNSKADTAKRRQSAPALPTKRTKNNIHDFIK